MGTYFARSSARVGVAAILGLLTLCLNCVHAPSAAANGWPDKVSARYKITFNGFEIGTFQFEATTNARSYVLSGSAELSALLGTVKWSGTTRSAGVLAGEEPRPATYAFDYKSNSKAGSANVAFSDGRVTKATIEPPPGGGRNVVPLQEQHLKDALDPMSAIMALTRGRVGNPCGRNISIFDGKQRFDLALSFRRQQNVAEAQPSGQPGIAYVCRVRYIPVAGHKNNEDTRRMASNAGIEVALRPIPSANLLIPYQITVPLVAGSALLTAQRVEITTGMRQIALVH